MPQAIWLRGFAMLSPVPYAPPKPMGRSQLLELQTMDDLKLPHELDTNLESEAHQAHVCLPSRMGVGKRTLGSMRRRRWKVEKEGRFRAFLKEHGFVDLHTPRKSSRSRLARLLRRQPEEVSMIHAAAREGDCLMLILALRHGVDPLQKTSHGRTALQLALAANSEGSHGEVISVLSKPLQTLSVQGFLRSMD